MISTTNLLTSQMQRLANFIVLEGEQGVLLVRPYTDDICAHWRFVDEDTARKSSTKIYEMFLGFKTKRDFIGMDMVRKFLEMGFTRARRYANHSREGSTIKCLVKSDHKSTIGEQIQKQKVLLFFKKVRDNRS